MGGCALPGSSRTLSRAVFCPSPSPFRVAVVHRSLPPSLAVCFLTSPRSSASTGSPVAVPRASCPWPFARPSVCLPGASRQRGHGSTDVCPEGCGNEGLSGDLQRNKLRLPGRFLKLKKEAAVCANSPTIQFQVHKCSFAQELFAFTPNSGTKYYRDNVLHIYCCSLMEEAPGRPTGEVGAARRGRSQGRAPVHV